MLEVLRADYLRTARAKGVPEKVVINKHAFKNALIPIITVVGTALSFSLAGSVAIEQVFSWPGVGRMAVEAVSMRDTPTVLGTVILTSTFYVLIQILVDIAYGFVDPRIKSRYVSKKRKKPGNKMPIPEKT
jgi:peptide/nickel transport system permease protein